MKKYPLACLLITLVLVTVSFGQKTEWQYSTRNQLPQAIAVSQTQQNILYLAQKSGVLLVLDTNQKKRSGKKIAQIRKARFKRLDAMNMVRTGNHLYIALGNFFGGKSKAGLAILDISSPRKPLVLSVWTSPKVLEGSAIVEVDGNYAYLGAMKHGVIILDVSNKRRVREVSRIKPDIHFPKRNPNKVQHPNARGLAVRDGFLYVANDAGGLRVVDISNKRNPLEISKYILRKPGLKQQAYNNIAINYPYAYIALDYCGMEVVNIRNPRNVKHVGWWNPWKCNTNSNKWFGSAGHTNHIVFDKTGSRVFMSSGDSELQVVDVSNPRRPRLSSSFGRPKNNQAVWGLTVTDDTVYLAYIKAFIPFRGTWAGVKAVSRKQF